MTDRAAARIPDRPRPGHALPRDKPVVAVLTPSYGMEKVSYLIPSERHRYTRLRRIPLQRLERRSTIIEETPFILGRKVDLVHTFNQLPLNRRFVVSAEMELPRFLFDPPAWQVRFGMRLLASRRCRGIWPLSEAARGFLLRRFARAGRGALTEKTTVFRGALPPSTSGPRDYATAGPIRLLFVGGDGLRKGLEPTLRAARRLREGGVEVEVTVIGQPTSWGYIVPGATFPIEWTAGMLASERWIHHHRSMSNAEVRALMARHDILVLPTMDESLGWVFAEAALEGTPSITTDIFAIPEMVLDGVTGWTIPQHLDEDRRWVHIGDAGAIEAWRDAQARIVDGIVVAIEAVARNRALAAQRGVAARSHIESLYGIDVARRRLEELYAGAIG